MSISSRLPINSQTKRNFRVKECFFRFQSRQDITAARHHKSRPSLLPDNPLHRLHYLIDPHFTQWPLPKTRGASATATRSGDRVSISRHRIRTHHKHVHEPEAVSTAHSGVGYLQRGNTLLTIRDPRGDHLLSHFVGARTKRKEGKARLMLVPSFRALWFVSVWPAASGKRKTLAGWLAGAPTRAPLKR